MKDMKDHCKDCGVEGDSFNHGYLLSNNLILVEVDIFNNCVFICNSCDLKAKE